MNIAVPSISDENPGFTWILQRTFHELSEHPGKDDDVDLQKYSMSETI